MIQKNRHMQREAIEDFLNPLNGYRGQLIAQGKTPINHMKKHREALRKTASDFQKKNTKPE